jgi:DNA-binding transcriptional ArsR family regulator
MENGDRLAELTAFFKALADANRLKIVGLLAQKEYTVEQLAAILNLRASTVSHHLTRLTKARLVSTSAEGNYSVYRLETDALEEMARRLLARDELPSIAMDVDVDAYDRKVIHNFTNPDGSLKSIPAQQKKLEAVLRYITTAFKPDKRYNEKEINAILERFHQDTTTLRRALIDYRFLDRVSSGDEYWLNETE